jgi:tetratricopeptide (TPR) repeat protein
VRRAWTSLALTLALLGPATARAEVDLEALRSGFEAVDDWRIDEARGLAERLFREDPSHPLVLALLADVKLHLSDYEGAVFYFGKAREAGAPASVLRNASLAEAARVATKGYAETVSEHFIVRHPPGKDAVLVPFALETLEGAMKEIGGLLGWRPSSRIVVEFYPSAKTLAAVSTLTAEEIANSGTIALCKWNRLMVTSPRGVVFGYGWRDTVAHELAHLIIGGASRNTVPIWLHEGIAKYVETAWRADPGLALSIESQEKLRAAAKKKTLIPFERMHPSMAKLETQEMTALAFAEVFTFIEYMVAQKGWDGMRTVLRLMSEGKSDEAAIAQVFGEPLDALSKRWMATLPTRAIKREGTQEQAGRAIVVKDRAETPDDKLHGLSKTARRFARAADLLYARGRLKAAQRELEKAFAETKSPLLGAKLANVALAVGDLDGAEKAARAAIDGIPDLPGPHVTLAEVLVRKTELAGAAAALEAAIAINPFDPRIHALRLAVLGDKGDEKTRLEAQIAIAILTGEDRARLPMLGTGALVEIDAVPFARVFVEKPLESGGSVLVPTGMVTPTAPIALRPGTVQIRLVPPSGEAITRSIGVEPTGPDGAPQRVAPNLSGS